MKVSELIEELQNLDQDVDLGLMIDAYAEYMKNVDGYIGNREISGDEKVNNILEPIEHYANFSSKVFG